MFNPNTSAVVPTDPTHSSRARLDVRSLIGTLHALREATRDGAFWAQLCAAAAALGRAQAALAIQREGNGTQWQVLGESDPLGSGLLQDWATRSAELRERALENGFAWSPQRDTGGAAWLLLLVRQRAAADTLLCLAIPERERAQINELTLRLQLVADLPANPPDTSATGYAVLLQALDLVAQVMREKHFGAAALAVVNGVAAQFGCAQVALGWYQGGYVRVQAISHIDRFERKMTNVQLLEAALEESLDQEQDLCLPQDQDGAAIVIAHTQLKNQLGYSAVCTLPLRLASEAPQAVLLLAQDEGDMDHGRLAMLQTALELALPWLSDLHDRDRWFGARMLAWADRAAGRLFSTEQGGRKLLVVAASLLLLYLLFGSWPYRVEATAQLTTDSTKLVSAPFDGYLQDVAVTSGDLVKKGEVLATLDTEELFLQESEYRADLRRYQAEADKARANGHLADVEIARARGAQAQARLDRVQYFLQQAKIVAAFDGVVVEGERKELLGAPVKKGERLFRLARIEGLYPVIMVGESDISQVSERARGELALLSQPDQNIPFQVSTIIPLAQVKDQKGNEFMVKGKLAEAPKDWWRPGMSGVARIDAGERHIAWILFHRLLDSLRLKLWW